MESARLHLLDVRKDAIKHLVRKGSLSEDLAEQIQAEVDGQVFQIIENEEEHLEELEDEVAKFALPEPSLDKGSETAASSDSLAESVKSLKAKED